MRRALAHLRAAQAKLEVAEHNKGGLRIWTLGNVDRAIGQTERRMVSQAVVRRRYLECGDCHRIFTGDASGVSRAETEARRSRIDRLRT
jgi:hypothetical protein